MVTQNIVVIHKKCLSEGVFEMPLGRDVGEGRCEWYIHLAAEKTTLIHLYLKIIDAHALATGETVGKYGLKLTLLSNTVRSLA